MRSGTRRFLARLAGLALAVALAASAPALALGLFFGGEEGVRASSIEDDGMLRVSLRSLENPQALHVVTRGEYAVESDPGFRFSRGAEAVLTASGGRVYLSVSGLSIDMGPSVTLTRHKSDGAENGLAILEAEYPENLYEGDLSLSAEGDALLPVLHIRVEDYLKGVIAYEMSDSFPLESLKAQAVAARTYAMQRKRSAGTRAYDLVDTTADQVFKGFDASYENVVLAVQETVGVVGTYMGGFATCYYTASNGGQTALPADVWGGDGDFGYLAQTYDPYDLDNPRSRVNSVTISEDGAGCDALRDMLEARLRDAVSAAGVQCMQLRLGKILAAACEDPTSEGSARCRTIRFTLSAEAVLPSAVPTAEPSAAAPADDPSAAPSAAASAQADVSAALYGIGLLRQILGGVSDQPAAGTWQALAGEFDVTLDVYTDVKDGLDLGINSSDVEIASVAREGNGFTVSLRRFGHGVGMSQRGAQWMAGQYGFPYDEILNFYYPGMALERIAWSAPEPTALDALPDSVGRARPDPTPVPTPAPLPALKDGEYYAEVAVSSGSLNVRKTPSTGAMVVDALSAGRRVIVTGDAGDGWVGVKTAEFEGYVKAEYLRAVAA